MENQFVAWILSNKVYFIYFCRVLSGAFDKVVKVWSQDGQVMHKFDGFRFVAFNTRYSRHLLGIKMMTTLLFSLLNASIPARNSFEFLRCD